jgi:hypothetical protein
MPEFGATQLLTQNAITFGLYSGWPALTITFWFCPVWPFQATATGAVQSTRYRSFEAAVDRLIHSPLYTKGATDHR